MISNTWKSGARYRCALAARLDRAPAGKKRGGRLPPPGVPVVACLLLLFAGAAHAAVTDVLDFRSTAMVRGGGIEDFDLASPATEWLLGHGFFPVERDPGGDPFAWMGETGSLALPLASPADRFLAVIGGGAPPELQIEALWNGMGLGARRAPQQPSRRLWPVPTAHQRPGLNRIDLRASRVERFPPDPRRLFFSLRRVELRREAQPPRNGPTRRARFAWQVVSGDAVRGRGEVASEGGAPQNGATPAASFSWRLSPAAASSRCFSSLPAGRGRSCPGRRGWRASWLPPLP